MKKVKLNNILERITVKTVTGDINIAITGVSFLPNAVSSSHLFVAISDLGKDSNLFPTDFNDSINKAISNGASAVVCDKMIDLKMIKKLKAFILVKDSRIALAELSNYFYDYPFNKLTLIGVTGTDGKTTTSHLIHYMFKNAGIKSACLGTINNKINDYINESDLTTSMSTTLNQIMDKCLAEKINKITTEVSSEGLSFKRVHGIKFDFLILTNITKNEHLNFHKSFKNYTNTKLGLFLNNFKECGYAILNKDDKLYTKFASSVNSIYNSKGKKNKNESVKIISYAIDKKADVMAQDIEYCECFSKFVLKIDDQSVKIKLNFPGKYNVYNALAAISVIYYNGISLAKIKRGIELINNANTNPSSTKKDRNVDIIEGRCQRIINNNELTIIVDDARTPFAIESFLKHQRIFCKNKIHVIFGASGLNSTKIKRYEIGKVIAKYADYFIITSANSFYKSSVELMNDLKSGWTKNTSKNYFYIKNRKQAIKYALRSSKKGDFILILGKGHETHLLEGNNIMNFNDAKVALSLLKKLRFKKK